MGLDLVLLTRNVASTPEAKSLAMAGQTKRDEINLLEAQTLGEMSEGRAEMHLGGAGCNPSNVKLGLQMREPGFRGVLEK